MCRPSPRAVPIFQCISSSSVLETLIEALKKENGMGGRTERGGPIKKPFRRLHERWRTSRGRTLLPNHAPSMHVSSKRLWHMLIMKNYEYCTSSIHPSSPLCVCGRRAPGFCTRRLPRQTLRRERDTFMLGERQIVLD